MKKQLINYAAILKGVTGLTYVDLTKLLNQSGMTVSKQTVYNRAKTNDAPLFDPVDFTKFCNLMNDPNSIYAEVGSQLREAKMALDTILGEVDVIVTEDIVDDEFDPIPDGDIDLDEGDFDEVEPPEEIEDDEDGFDELDDDDEDDFSEVDESKDPLSDFDDDDDEGKPDDESSDDFGDGEDDPLGDFDYEDAEGEDPLGDDDFDDLDSEIAANELASKEKDPDTGSIDDLMNVSSVAEPAEKDDLDLDF